jgi:hypothetical protein
METKMSSPPPSRRKLGLFYLIVAGLAFAGSSAVYGASILLRAKPFYEYAKTKQRGWSGITHQSDPVLGFAPIPGASGSHVFPIGPDIPMQYDDSGFRVPVPAALRLPRREPLILALGCSFTYGDATPAEQTFPHLTAELLGGSVLNAGVGSYGLAQMLILARRLIPKYKPDYVLVQYSPWLVDRARTPFAPTYYGVIATPFFTDDLTVQPPVFPTAVLRLSFDRYRDTGRSKADFLSFTWNVAVPLFVHDDFHMLVYRIKRAAGFMPAPATQPEKVINHVYGEIAALARQHGVRMIVVGLDNRPKRMPPPDEDGQEGAVFVNAHDSLVDALPVLSQECYDGRYGHWRGTPPVLVDGHPNALAHRMIGETIATSIMGRRISMRIDSSSMETPGCLLKAP